MIKIFNILPTVFWCLTFYILGIIWCLLKAPIVFIFIIILLNSYLLYKTKSLLSYLLFLLIFLFAITRINNINDKYQEFNHCIINKRTSCFATVVNIEKASSKKFKNIIDLNVTEFKNINFKRCNKTCLVRVYAIKKTKLNIGDQIELSNIFIGNTFDEFYLKTNDIYAITFANNLEYNLINSSKNSISNFINNYKNQLTKNLKNKLNNNTYNLFNTIFLGKKLNNKNLDKVKQNFKNWGISHFLARSGLHIILVLLLIALFIKFIPMNFRLKKLATLIVVLIYYLLSWSSISFLRALLLLLFSNYFFWRNSYTYPLSILTFIAFLFLIYNPFYLIRLDFQLTFFTTFGLIIFYEIKKRKVIS